MLHEKLSRLKTQTGMSAQQIAEKGHVPASTVSRVLSGQTPDPSFLTVSSMVQALGGSLDELAGLPPPAPPEAGEGSYVLLLAEKDARLADKDRTIRWLVVACFILGLVAFGYIIWDATYPGAGLIQY